MNVFDLQAKISLDSSGFAKNLGKAKDEMSGFGAAVEGICSKIGGALAVAFSVDTVKNFVSGAVTEFGRLEQLIGGVDTLFGADSDALQTLADNAYKTAGLSANEYLDTSMSFAASLLQALGGDTAAAVGMVDMAVTDMADNANKMGTNIGSIQNAYQGFAKQNYTMLDNLKLGYGGTKSEMARLINDTGILGDTMVTVSTMTTQGNFEEVVSFDTIVEAIHRVQENMKITGTTAAEASGTIEGSVNSMKAAWSNWQAGLADPDADMTVLTDNLVSSFQTAADNVVPAVQRIRESVGEVFTHLTGIDLTPVTTVFDTLKASLADIGAAFAEGGLSAGFGEITSQIEQLTGIDLSGVVGGIQGFADAFTGIKDGFADGGVVGGLTAIIDAIGSATGLDLSGLVGGIQGFADAVSNIADGFKEGGVVGGVSAIVEAFKGATGIDLSGVVGGIGNFFDVFIGADDAVIKNIGDAITAIVNAFDSETAAAVISEVSSALGRFISEISRGAGDVISGVATAVEWLATHFNALLPLITGAATAISTFIVIVKGMEIINNIPALLAAAGTAITGFKTAFMGLNAVIAANPIAAIIALVSGLVAAFATAMATNDQFRDNVINVLTMLKEVFQEVFSIIADIPRGIRENFAEIGAAISELVGIIKSKISEFAQAGRDLIAGFVNGVTEKLASAKEAITGAFGKVTDWVNGVFDRHSPSKVFAEIGRDLMRGLAVGVDDESGIVQDSINRLRLTVPAISTGKVDFAHSAIGKASSAAINGIMAAGSSSGGVYNIALNVDGRTLAQVVFDPLNGLIKQKGVAFGA